ncbi:MAG: carbamoyltransferase HypF [Eubacteriales bacterium]|nr:carbamoyltransferase HypF [Eubacteriales bacterium]
MESRKIRKKIRVFGIVQGVGFRPFVSRIADEYQIAGSVCNKGPFVEIFAEGMPDNAEAFLTALRERAPERSRILKMDVREEAVQGTSQFHILPSEYQKGNVFVSPDIATCPKCKEELFDPKNRRYLHPFINCTACGPRLTILENMPYDRARTSMKKFPMCPSCEYEYTHSETRRYHAQPVCCKDCGPRLYALDPKRPEERSVMDGDAIRLLRKTIMDGGICAVKGIGGFHLALDAGNDEAVKRIRRLKNRPYKPLAVMAKDMETVRRECRVLPGMEAALTGAEKPILLMEKKPGGMISPLAAPDNDRIGIMLPYAPVQMLLFSYPDGLEMTDVLIMTSANPSGAPICREDQDVLENLGGLCDLVVSHDRDIRIRADDSVMGWLRGEPSMIRRSRGYAPLPFFVQTDRFGSREAPTKVLGIGGELKNTFCFGSGDLFYPSPYVGDLSDIRTMRALEDTVKKMEQLLDIRPEAVCCDLHPGYQSSAYAARLSEERGIPLCRIQHHYAHILSCMAENDEENPVIGLAFDGTGYGIDGTIWGSEFLLADFSGFKRLGSCEPFYHAGGDRASQEGYRIAASILDMAAEPEETEKLADSLGICKETELRIIRMMIRNGINTVHSTSMGRVFDAASAILGFRRISTVEGEAAMVLQTMSERYAKEELKDSEAGGDIYESEFLRKVSERVRGEIPEVLLRLKEAPFEAKTKADSEESEDGLFRIRTGDLLLWLARERMKDPENGKRNRELAYLFHEAIAEQACRGAVKASEITGVRTIALSGGVFQNLLLTALLKDKLEDRGFRVLTHRLVPANDGGISLGQAVYAQARLSEKQYRL